MTEEVWNWSAAKKRPTQPQVPRSSGGRPITAVTQGKMSNAWGDNPVFLPFHHRNCFWWQLICATWCQKINILFWSICDVTVKQCNVQGQGPDMRVAGARTRTQSAYLRLSCVVLGSNCKQVCSSVSGWCFCPPTDVEVIQHGPPPLSSCPQRR